MTPKSKERKKKIEKPQLFQIAIRKEGKKGQVRAS